MDILTKIYKHSIKLNMRINKRLLFFLIVFISNIPNLFCSGEGENWDNWGDWYHNRETFPLGEEYIEFHIYGNIKLQEFYGPPNFGETPELDTIEQYYILELYEPITFVKGEEIVTVEEIQLLFPNGIKKEIDTDWGYIIDGKLYFAETGHHHTPVILFVDRIIENG
jgi:hypothetical protein